MLKWIFTSEIILYNMLKMSITKEMNKKFTLRKYFTSQEVMCVGCKHPLKLHFILINKQHIKCFASIQKLIINEVLSKNDAVS